MLVTINSKYFVVFASPNIYVHTTNILKADVVYEKHVGGLLSPPIFTNDDVIF